MKVTLIGMGCGPETLTAEASGALAEADLCVGAARLLGYLPESDAARIAEYRPGAICALLEEKAPERACVLLSGDSGFYSGAAKLRLCPGCPACRSWRRSWDGPGRTGFSAPPTGRHAIRFPRSCRAGRPSS